MTPPPSKIRALWTAILAATAGVLAMLPLFGLLGFESSFVLAIVASLASAHLAARQVAAWRQRANAEGALRARPARWLRRGARLLGENLALLGLPLAILVGNALRVKNCNLMSGFGWFAMLPVLSTVTGTAAGVCAGLAARRRGGALAIGIVLASVLWGVARFYAAPPVFGFDPFVGWFPGSLYDEELSVSTAFVTARAVHLLGALAALAVVAAFLDDEAILVGWRVAHRRRLAVAAPLVVAWAVAWSLARPLIAPDARTIADALGGRRQTEHLVLLYSPAGPWAKDLDLHATDAEFRYQQLVTALGVSPPVRITCFLFDSAEQKQRYLGAAHTQIAKPWRREIYLQYEAFPHPVIQHELAHVFAGEFGDPLFRVSRRDLRFNVGLIEGLAVAAERRHDGPELAREVKAMREAGIEPRLDAVFGLGFLEAAPARAYTVAGSFVRWLLDEQGADKVRAIYRDGGSPDGWRRIYGVSFAELGDAWRKVVDATPLDERERAGAIERTRRPSVFHRTCAHELALRRQRAHELSAHNNHEEAIAWLERVCADEPDDPGPLLDVMSEQAAMRRSAQAEATAHRLLDHPKASDGQKARALLFLVDQRLSCARAAPATPAAAPSAVTVDPCREARQLVERASALPLDEDSARQLRARALALDPERPRALRIALAAYLAPDELPRDSALDVWRAQRVVDAAPDDGIGHYLLGRMLHAHGRWSDAAVELGRALELGLPEGGFTVAAERLAAVAAFRADQPCFSKAALRQILALRHDAEASPAVRADAADWFARVQYFPAAGCPNP